MKKFQFFLILLLGLSFWTQVDADSDGDFFTIIYSKISDLMAPGAKTNDPSSGATSRPGTVFLMELPGLAITREDLDVGFWRNAKFAPRSPDAVFAALVDRAPKYADVTFQDSGARISDLWKLFMTSFLVPPNDDPVPTAQAAAAREALYNSSLEQGFLAALASYDAAQQAAITARKDCLARTDDVSFCAVTQVVPEMLAKTAWLSMETRRRDLLGAQAAVLAMQSADLRSVFAEALQQFQRSLRVDVGAEGYGTEYYQTFATPSDWHTWFPQSLSRYDLVAQLDPATSLLTASFLFADCRADGVPCLVLPTASALVAVQPQNGLVAVSGTAVTYTANPGFSGSDIFGLDALGDGTAVLSISVGVPSRADRAQSAAFVSVAATSAETSSASSSSYSALSVSAQSRFNAGWCSFSGGYDVAAVSSRSAFLSSASSVTLRFSLAKVLVSRPWLNPLLLSFSPVGIKGVAKNAWSDGTGLPNAGLQLRLPLLPTAFLVAKDIQLSSTNWGALGGVAADASSFGTTISANWGPFYSGTARSASSYGSQYSFQRSTYAGNSLSIDGPQIIGWICTTLPAFPNAEPNDPQFQYASK